MDIICEYCGCEILLSKYFYEWTWVVNIPIPDSNIVIPSNDFFDNSEIAKNDAIKTIDHFRVYNSLMKVLIDFYHKGIISEKELYSFSDKLLIDTCSFDSQI